MLWSTGKVFLQYETEDVSGMIWGVTQGGVGVFEGEELVEKELKEFGGTHTQRGWKKAQKRQR